MEADPLRKRALEKAISDDLYKPESYLLTALSCLIAIPLGAYVMPARYKFTPLFILGLAGSIADTEIGRRRMAPVLEE